MSLAKLRNKNGLGDYVCLVLLFVINLLNYMDRFTIAGVLTQVQAFFSIDDTGAGLLQTVFIIFYMIFAPLIGFFGDRYNRKWIMITGIAIWVLAVLASSFVPANSFWLFLLLRGVVGIGEASYSTVAPTIIGDLFTTPIRSRAIMFFYFAIPVGSGMGYIVSAIVASLFGGWQWGLRVTPILGVLCIIFVILGMKEPKRGEAENAFPNNVKQTPTYVYTTFAYTSVVFVTGTLTWWGPAAIEHSVAMQQNLNSTHELSNEQKNSIALSFGVVTVIGGILGVSGGTFLSQLLLHGKWCCKPFKTNRANPLDIIVPQRRSVANSWQILISHLFGDASGPYIVGLVSDWIRGSETTPTASYHSLAKAFYIPTLILLASIVLFIAASISFVDDRKKFLKQIDQYSKYGKSNAKYNRKVVDIENGTKNDTFQ
ncbi:transporter, major facilitator family protein [Onchocerca flexuosa]|uniref:Transporter, major facilitator family protein n=1 Tax=Onchocerca flexuosa TaxID=387005 RepID=A0A238C5G5_9BILA|nr:transporter, major facilitator family protein [Onchocerca flexuosa]